MNTITRKIKLNLVGDIKEGYKTLYRWNEQVFRAANIAASHMYFQNKMKEFFYLTDSAKILFANINKEPKEGETAERVLNTSKQNSTYQVLSSIYKSKIPSDIFTNLNAQIISTFNKESKEYFSGKRSLRSYRRGIPMPVSAKNIRNITLTEDKRNYHFDLLGLSFKTYFGRDMSGNKIMFDKFLCGEYKLCTSSIQLDGKNIFLLTVFQFESDVVVLKSDKQVICRLDPNFPIVIKGDKKDYVIGDMGEYLHRRISIRNKRRELQKSLKYTNGGHGRTKKLAALDRYEKYEQNYVNTRMHNYSRELIDYCIKNKIGTIVLENYEEIKEESKEAISKTNNEPLLRSWSFSNLVGKILYKATINGIKVIKPKQEKDDQDIQI